MQDRLEDDERCSRLEKFDRLEIFQEYIRDLEKEEDEQRKIRKVLLYTILLLKEPFSFNPVSTKLLNSVHYLLQEHIKRVERKNRDEFRKLLDEDVISGTLTAKTQWRDYCQKVV